MTPLQQRSDAVKEQKVTVYMAPFPSDWSNIQLSLRSMIAKHPLGVGNLVRENNHLHKKLFSRRQSRNWDKHRRFSLLYRACCFNYFFNIPNHAPTIYTLKSTKIRIKNNFKTCPYMFRSNF
jgi:hypothetical protein